MTGSPGRFEVTLEATEAVLAVLSASGVQADPERPVGWQRLARDLVTAALPLLVPIDPPTTQRQDELDGEYVLSLRAQARAADLQAEHSQALARLVERSEELVDLQSEVARRQLAEVTGPVTEYALWRDALLIAGTTTITDDLWHLEAVAIPIRESLRWAGPLPRETQETAEEPPSAEGK